MGRSRTARARPRRSRPRRSRCAPSRAPLTAAALRALRSGVVLIVVRVVCRRGRPGSPGREVGTLFRRSDWSLRLSSSSVGAGRAPASPFNLPRSRCTRRRYGPPFELASGIGVRDGQKPPLAVGTVGFSASSPTPRSTRTHRRHTLGIRPSFCRRAGALDRAGTCGTRGARAQPSSRCSVSVRCASALWVGLGALLPRSLLLYLL
jgi:hypothetical protein